MRCYQTQPRPQIINNRCYRNLAAGIGTEGAAVALIEGNECYENARAGIGQRGDAQTTLIGNHCHHNKTSGIGFAACKTGQATLRDNKIIDNAPQGANVFNNTAISQNPQDKVVVIQGLQAKVTNNVLQTDPK